MGLECILIEALGNLGGQCSALYPDKEILDIPGLPRVLARDLISSLIKQAMQFGPEYLLERKITALTKGVEADTWRLCTSHDAVVCKSVVIATGGGAFDFNKIPLPEARQFEGVSLFYAIKDKSAMQDKVVSIIGGGDAALDWTLALADTAKTINLIHRRDNFKATPISLDRLATLSDQGKVKVFTPYQLGVMAGHDGQLTSITLAACSGDGAANQVTLDTDVLLACFGLAMARNTFEAWGINIESGKIIVDKASYATNLPLIYAIGDAATYEGKITSLLSAFAEGAAAARSIRRQLKGQTGLDRRGSLAASQR
jgi:thioredoxin reductase (NADPH)